MSEARISSSIPVEYWPHSDELWCRERVKAVLAWYLLRYAMGKVRFARFYKVPASSCPIQSAAKREAAVYFDRLLESGAWSPDMAWKLVRINQYLGVQSSLKDGWLDSNGNYTGMSMIAARFVRCALSGGKASGERFHGVAAELKVPEWSISQQLRDAVAEDS